MKRTYYIVEHIDTCGQPEWRAYKRGVLSTFNIFGPFNSVDGTYSCRSPERVKEQLYRSLNPTKPKIVEVVRM